VHSTVRAFLRSLGTIIPLAMFITALGCGRSQQVAAPVDAVQARKTLEAVLSDWQSGGTPEAWQQKSPKVVVQDFDWAGGAKLSTFEILGPGEVRDANLYCQVKIVAALPTQSATPRTVTYVVGTDPVLTIFRDSLQ